MRGRPRGPGAIPKKGLRQAKVTNEEKKVDGAEPRAESRGKGKRIRWGFQKRGKTYRC